MSKPRKKAKDLTVNERLKAQTPKFFRRVRRAGKWLGFIGGALVTVGAALVAPPVGLALGTYLVAGGTVLGTIGGTAVAVSSTVVDEEALNESESQSQ